MYEPPPIAPPPPNYAPAPVAVGQPRRSNTVVILGVVVAVQALVIIGLLVLLGFMLFVGPFFMDPFFDDSVFMLTDDVGYEVRALVESGDVDGYLALYDRSDPHVDLRKVREDFEAAHERVVAHEGSVDVYPGMWQEYRDVDTGERLVRMDLDLSDWNTGRTVARLRVWVEADAPAGEVVLTGNVDRQLEPVGMSW